MLDLENGTYRGIEIFSGVNYISIYNLIYMFVEDHFNIGDNYDSDMSGQECYLGYNSDKDTFICGYDVWNRQDDADQCGFVAVEFQIKEARLYQKGLSVCEFGDMFYRKGYQLVKEKYPNIIDVRLD